jgi:hypothetical protein
MYYMRNASGNDPLRYSDPTGMARKDVAFSRVLAHEKFRTEYDMRQRMALLDWYVLPLGPVGTFLSFLNLLVTRMEPASEESMLTVVKGISPGQKEFRERRRIPLIGTYVLHK